MVSSRWYYRGSSRVVGLRAGTDGPCERRDDFVSVQRRFWVGTRYVQSYYKVV